MEYRGYKINSVKCEYFAYPIGKMPTVKNTINPLHWNGLYGEEAALDRIKGAIDAKLDGASIQMLVRGLHTKSGNPHAFSI